MHVHAPWVVYAALPSSASPAEVLRGAHIDQWTQPACKRVYASAAQGSKSVHRGICSWIVLGLRQPDTNSVAKEETSRSCPMCGSAQPQLQGGGVRVDVCP
eukprot:1161224-Pelagomonas_calceolata.AAC.7